MESTSFASPRTDAFPAGLRVLVVDDDLTWLKILEKMLKKCSYEVTTCGLAREALDLLRERKDGFDIVISDVNMPDMDGFKLLEHVGLEMDLPVIMMSVDGETRRVMKGVQHGACDYLLKPIRMKELRNIWQHVLRKRIHEVRDIDSLNGLEEIQMMSNGLDHADDAYLFSATDLSSGRKRKDTENKHDDKEHSDTSSVKKPRVVWTVDLHQKFVKAVNQIGLDKVGPKKILDLMGVPRLTRENVASHLQKYRLYLSRLQKENELKASFGSARPSDLPPRDPSGNACPPNHLNTQQNDVISGKCDISGKKNLMQNADSKVHEGGMKGNVSIPIAETMKAPSGDTTYSKKTSSSKMGLNHPFRAPDSDATYAASTHMQQHSWTLEYPQIPFKQEYNADFHLVNKLNHLPLPTPKHLDHTQPSSSFTSRPSSSIRDELANTELKPSNVKSRSLSIGEVLQAESVVDLFPINLTNCHSFEPIPSPTWSIKNTGSDQVLLNDMESAQRNLFLGRGSALGSSDKDLLSYSLHGDFQPINIGLASAESLDYIDPELFAAITPSVYQPLRFDYEYPAIDQSLFIV